MTLKVHTLTFNPWQENTYLISNQDKECIVIDPGCLGPGENEYFNNYLKKNDLTPVRLINTHLHLDHVFGINHVCDTYNIGAEAHVGDEFWIEKTVEYAAGMGVSVDQNPHALKDYLEHNQEIEFGGSKLKILHIPGHSPGGIVIYNVDNKFVVVGDVLFRESIGRADLPGGDFDTLIAGIKQHLLSLPDDVKVYPGHGPSTTIGYERAHNMFLQ